MRATSKRLCFMASMARSNSTLSGCFDPTLASGFTDFLFVHATVNASNNASSAKLEFRPIEDLKTFPPRRHRKQFVNGNLKVGNWKANPGHRCLGFSIANIANYKITKLQIPYIRNKLALRAA